MTNGLHGVNYNADSLLGPGADLTIDPEAAAKVRGLLTSHGQDDLVAMVLGEVAA